LIFVGNNVIMIRFGGCYLLMKIYDENGKMIEGNWKLCKEIVLEYDKKNPFEHDEIIRDTAQQLAKEYNVDYDDVVKTVELLSGIQL